MRDVAFDAMGAVASLVAMDRRKKLAFGEICYTETNFTPER